MTFSFSIELLKGSDLELAYFLAIGYTGFEYVDSRQCWRAEKKISELGINLVVAIDDRLNCEHDNSAFHKNFTTDDVLKIMQEENIGLEWTVDKKHKLYFQAMPEISAIDKSFTDAFMRVIIKKELGVIDSETLEKMNVSKQRKVEKLI